MTKKKNRVPPSFETRIDWEGVRLAWGIGLGVAAVGAVVLWASLTAPAGDPPETMSRVMDLPYQATRLIPTTTQGVIASIMGGIFVLGGAAISALGFTLFLPSKRVLKRKR